MAVILLTKNEMQAMTIVGPNQKNTYIRTKETDQESLELLVDCYIQGEKVE